MMSSSTESITTLSALSAVYMYITLYSGALFEFDKLLNTLHLLVFITTEGKIFLNNTAIQLARNAIQLSVSFNNAVCFPILLAIYFTFWHFQHYFTTFSSLRKCFLFCKMLRNSVHPCDIITKAYFFHSFFRKYVSTARFDRIEIQLPAF